MKKAKEPASATIRWICEHCQKLAVIEGSVRSGTFILRLKHAVCPHCGHPKVEHREPEEGFFKCVACHVIYRITRYFRPVKGHCMVCYMRLWRKKRAEMEDCKH